MESGKLAAGWAAQRIKIRNLEALSAFGVKTNIHQWRNEQKKKKTGLYIQQDIIQLILFNLFLRRKRFCHIDNSRGIMLHERSQSQGESCMIPS